MELTARERKLSRGERWVQEHAGEEIKGSVVDTWRPPSLGHVLRTTAVWGSEARKGSCPVESLVGS